jgi:hypothetical protein
MCGAERVGVGLPARVAFDRRPADAWHTPVGDAASLVDPDELLRDEIQRRLREKGEAWEKLDRVLDKRVAANGDDPEAPPVHHQERS